MPEKFFKKKEIHYEEQDAVEELMELYEEEKDILDEDEATLKEIIQKQRKKHTKKVLVIFLVGEICFDTIVFFFSKCLDLTLCSYINSIRFFEL